VSVLGAPATATPASILVVDDDRRVVELLTIALNAYGYRVIQASDGEEALRLAARERPDLVVLDVRLPKRSGYEVCEMLRQDPDDPHLPIIMVSAAAETEARLQGLSRGADDYVAKPFSPKELIARIRRLLVRSAESREARRRSREAEHELAQAREEARRSHAELRDQTRLRDLHDGFTRDFHATLDETALVRRLLIEAQTRLGTGMAALLRADAPGTVLRLSELRGEAPERIQGLGLEPRGELLALLSGLGRPVRRRDLDRFPELRVELQPLVAAGIAVLAPLRGPDGLIGIMMTDERFDGAEIEAADLEALSLLCKTAALALRNAGRISAQAEALLEALEAMARLDVDAETLAAREAAVERMSAGALPAWCRRELACAMRVADWVRGEPGAGALAAMVARDDSGRLARVERLIHAARDLDSVPSPEAEPTFDAALALLREGLLTASRSC
jgi:DNA-binding response OmpR family regulator